MQIYSLGKYTNVCANDPCMAREPPKIRKTVSFELHYAEKQISMYMSDEIEREKKTNKKIYM